MRAEKLSLVFLSGFEAPSNLRHRLYSNYEIELKKN
jgi:hypothetical protein